MLRLCAWCHRVMGMKAPFWPIRRLFEQTHGLCASCYTDVVSNQYLLKEYEKTLKEYEKTLKEYEKTQKRNMT